MNRRTLCGLALQDSEGGVLIEPIPIRTPGALRHERSLYFEQSSSSKVLQYFSAVHRVCPHPHTKPFGRQPRIRSKLKYLSVLEKNRSLLHVFHCHSVHKYLLRTASLVRESVLRSTPINANRTVMTLSTDVVLILFR